MSKYRITLEGKTYEMEIELVEEGGTVKSVNEISENTASASAFPAKMAQSEFSNGRVVAPMHGTVNYIFKNVGDEVKAGELVMILEAMKMENEILSPVSGIVSVINCTTGGTVKGGDVLFEIK